MGKVSFIFFIIFIVLVIIIGLDTRLQHTIHTLAELFR